METRLRLHEILCEILGNRNVYFQPPELVKMTYPAIVYSLNNIDNSFANDGVYLSKKQYSITLIDKNPDSLLVDGIAYLPTCKFNRHYQKDNLNHYVFTLYF